MHASVYVHIVYVCVHVCLYTGFFSFCMSCPVLPLLHCLGQAPELCYSSNYNGFDSLVSRVRKAAVTEISKFCQQLSSEVTEPRPGQEELTEMSGVLCKAPNP